MKKTSKKQRKLLVGEFNKKYGGIDGITKDGSIILHEGHTLWIEEQTKTRHRFTGKFKELKDKYGYSEAIFTKKKYPTKVQDIGIYCRDIDDFITHMKRVRRLVRQCGFKTYECSWWGKIKITVRYYFNEVKKWFDHKNYERRFRY